MELDGDILHNPSQRLQTTRSSVFTSSNLQLNTPQAISDFCTELVIVALADRFRASEIAFCEYLREHGYLEEEIEMISLKVGPDYAEQRIMDHITWGNLAFDCTTALINALQRAELPAQGILTEERWMMMAVADDVIDALVEKHGLKGTIEATSILKYAVCAILSEIKRVGGSVLLETAHPCEKVELYASEGAKVVLFHPFRDATT